MLSERQPRFEGIATPEGISLRTFFRSSMSERQPRFEGIATRQSPGPIMPAHESERQPRFEGIATKPPEEFYFSELQRRKDSPASRGLRLKAPSLISFLISCRKDSPASRGLRPRLLSSGTHLPVCRKDSPASRGLRPISKSCG